MQPLRIVFDTNIYLMAAGMPGGYIEYWLDLATPPGNRFQLYTSPLILTEIQRKLEKKLHIERQLAVEYVDRIKHVTITVNPAQKLTVIERDPDDIMILECAVEANADIIVSADKDLLQLKHYKHTQIQHPTNLKYIFQYLEHKE